MFQEHLSNLREVFSHLSEAGLKLKTSKCKLLHKQVGHILLASGVDDDTLVEHLFCQLVHFAP